MDPASGRITRGLRTIAAVTGATMALGVLFAVLFEDAHPHAIMNGLSIGFLIGVIGSPMEIFLFPRLRGRYRFTPFLLMRSLFYLTLIAVTVFFVTLHHTSEMVGTTYAGTLSADEFREFLFGGGFLFIIGYAFLFSVLINLGRDMNGLLGPGVLWNYVTGRYHHPTEENRAFMFLDLKSSTTIAEKLGNARYHRFLNDFFFDISPAVVSTRGEIYQYVGDEVVLSWRERNIAADANCLRCFFQIRRTIERRSADYRMKYGVVPEFKAGCHFGPVTTGEIGDLKKEIVFHGDTVNTASRIRSECSLVGRDLLVSSDLLRKFSTGGEFVAERMGSIRLRGKETDVELFSIRPNGRERTLTPPFHQEAS
jgi:adenylate cyclase